MAVIVPKEEGVISVSEDRYEPLSLGREEGRDGPADPSPLRGLCLHVGASVERSPKFLL